MHLPQKLPSWRYTLLIGGVAIVCGAVIAAGVIWERSATREATTAPAPSFVVVGTQSQDWAQSVTATFTLTRPITLVAPTEGVVTAVLIDGSNPVTNGLPVMSVDDMTIRAVTGETPLFRSLSINDTGQDVAALGQLLQDLHYLPAGPPVKSYTDGVAAAVRQYQREAHLPVTGAFDPASVLYVPSSTTLTGLDVRVGQRIEAGTAIAETLGAATSVRFTTDNQDQLAHLRSGERTLRAGGSNVSLPGLRPAGPDLASLNQQLRELSAAGEIALESSGAENDDSTEVFRDLQLALSTPQRRGTIPVTSLYTSSSGAQCVWVRGKGGVMSARRVEAAAAPTNLGMAFVPSELGGARIVRDASMVPDNKRAKCA